MILTQCAACAAPLGLASGKKCGRCSTRYCGPACQKQHWDGGHKELCRRIKKGGGAEQYHADKKYKEAVADAVEACANNTKGQTCYICLEAVHARTGEGLVRGCACGDRESVASGNTGVAHVSCLAEQAKILYDEAEENNLDDEAQHVRWLRWDTCGLCEQQYHGAVLCALGWACWKTYVGRPETDWTRCKAMGKLGCGLCGSRRWADALPVLEARLSTMTRLNLGTEPDMLLAYANVANTYQMLGKLEQAMPMRMEAYSRSLRILGAEHRNTLIEVSNYSDLLNRLDRHDEAKLLMRKALPVARRVLGEDDRTTLWMRCVYSDTLYYDQEESINTLEDTLRIARRVLGGAHPDVVRIEQDLAYQRAVRRRVYLYFGILWGALVLAISAGVWFVWLNLPASPGSVS